MSQCNNCGQEFPPYLYEKLENGKVKQLFEHHYYDEERQVYTTNHYCSSECLSNDIEGEQK